jgi:hypothetical protein
MLTFAGPEIFHGNLLKHAPTTTFYVLVSASNTDVENIRQSRGLSQGKPPNALQTGHFSYSLHLCACWDHGFSDASIRYIGPNGAARLELSSRFLFLVYFSASLFQARPRNLLRNLFQLIFRSGAIVSTSE